LSLVVRHSVSSITGKIASPGTTNNLDFLWEVNYLDPDPNPGIFIILFLSFLANMNSRQLRVQPRMRAFSYALILHRSALYMYYRNRLLINKFNTRGHGYVLERRFTKFSEITQCNRHYVVQGHSRSTMLVPIESSSKDDTTSISD